MRILIAEDENVSRLYLETTLARDGYQVVSAADGLQAWEVLKGDDGPALAILDWVMPGLDGVELCRRVRGLNRPGYTYIIMLTAKTQRQELVAAMEAGADDYINKPFHPAELRVRLRAGQRILELEEALRRQATYDVLTGARNRAAIFDVVQRELARAGREQAPFGVLIADLDHFKTVNDVYGHPAGDVVLCEAARRMAAVIRPYDTLGRYGGEEFLIALPGCDRGMALEIAERVRAAVAAEPVATPSGPVAITVSLGASVTGNSQGLSREALIRRADQALYRAKALGRNRVEVASAVQSVEPSACLEAPAPGSSDGRRGEGPRKADVRAGAGAFDAAAALERVQGDRGMLRELIRLFLADAPGQLAAVRAAVDRRDGPGLRATAHALKGAAGVVSAHALAGAALQLEQVGRDGSWEGAAELAAVLERELAQLTPALTAWAADAAPRVNPIVLGEPAGVLSGVLS